MAATPQNKLLRVGVIQNGRIVEEHHVRRDNVTIGSDARNTIVLPSTDDRPARFSLLENQGQQFQLVIDEGMQGRVNLGSSDVDFDSLRQQGLATRRGDLYVLPLQESARGKVDLGDATLFFQFVTPPPEEAKPLLPADIRVSRWKTMDRVFFGILAASLLIHFSGAALIISSEAPKEPELALDQLDDRFVRAIIPQRPVEAPKVAEAGPGEEAPKEDKKGDEGKEAADKPASKPAGDAAEHRAEVVKKVSGKGLLKILGSNSGGGQGAFADVLGGASGGGDIAAALAGAGGVGVATEASVGGGTGPRGGGTGRVTGIGEVGTQGGGNVDLGTKKEAQVQGRVQDAAPDVESSDVDRAALARYVRSRLKSIQACYEKELKRNPNLKGKVVVRFVIKPSGRAGEVDIEENTLGNEAVGSCIRTTIRNWSFPFKPDSDTAVSYPFVFSPAG
ncbi:AgmX/PglI C-terminal domain-containing protein [Pyxidicoccus parkwayensis]|uniref:AgmX/PglI C-terminal domain-containing protein n=1 Tax=Pyxidicoccus parkwayensis TaxID=2813578 RepID=A0ABX7NPN6_9BACT|nr:AgmX/PglI C-terminal domain-containing protein [Pyxidicoccus parkwaysis]QSQ19414.1 AgmX/PglI C-terminal domain-containing protein [Pyxidicoccus parkwaysis]